MVESYLNILGVDQNANLNDIKRAYRVKAKELHPDRNDAPDAHEKFVSLTEAYEYLLENWMYLKPTRPKTEAEILAERERERAYRKWLWEESLRIKKKAEEMSRMKFEEFKKTQIYRTTNALSSLTNYLAIFFGLAVIVGAFTGLFSQMEDDNKTGSIVVVILTSCVGVIFIVYTISVIIKNRKEE